MKIKIIRTVLALLLCTLIGCSSDSQAANESPLTPDGKIKTYRFELDGGLTYLVPQTWEYEETDDGYNHYPPNKDGFLITSASKTETEMPADTVLLYDPEELTKTMWGDIWTDFQFKEKETYYISDRAGMALRLTCVNEEGNKLDAVVSAITNKNYIYTFLFGTIDNMDGTVIGENYTEILNLITIDGVKGRKIIERVSLTGEPLPTVEDYSAIFVEKLGFTQENADLLAQEFFRIDINGPIESAGSSESPGTYEVVIDGITYWVYTTDEGNLKMVFRVNPDTGGTRTIYKNLAEMAEPVRGTGDAVAYIEAKAFEDIKGMDLERIKEAYNFLVENYPNYYSSEEMMEKVMYNAELLEHYYRYGKDDLRKRLYKLGDHAFSSVRLVYSKAMTQDDPYVQNFLELIPQDIAKIQEALASE